MSARPSCFSGLAISAQKANFQATIAKAKSMIRGRKWQPWGRSVKPSSQSRRYAALISPCTSNDTSTPGSASSVWSSERYGKTLASPCHEDSRPNDTDFYSRCAASSYQPHDFSTKWTDVGEPHCPLPDTNCPEQLDSSPKAGSFSTTLQVPEPLLEKSPDRNIKLLISPRESSLLMRASASWFDDPSITKGEASQRRALVQSFMSKLAKERNEMLGWHWTPPKNFLESVV